MNGYLSVGIAVEPVMYDGVLTNLYRAIVTTMAGEVVDRTGLYNHRPEAEAQGAELVRLYEEKGQSRETRIGFISFEAMESLERGEWKSCTIFKDCTDRAVVPVYIKLNDALTTQAVKL